MKGYKILPEFKTSDNDTIPCVGIGTYEKSEGQLTDLFSCYPFSRIMIDTAKIYGNESAVSNAIHKNFISRERVVIIGKVSLAEQEKNQVLESFYRSLNLLKIDFFDYYLIHSPRYEKYVETWESLCILREKGLIRHLGVSNFEINHLDTLQRYFDELPIINQLCIKPYSDDKTELIDYCKNGGVIVQAAMPFGGRNESSKLTSAEHKIILEKYYLKSIIPIFGTCSPQHMLDNLSTYKEISFNV